MGCHLKDLYVTIFSTIIIRLPKVAMYEVLVVTSYGYEFHSVGDNPFSTRIVRVSSQNETGGYYPKPVCSGALSLVVGRLPADAEHPCMHT